MKKRYWLRGGIIGLVTSIVMFFFGLNMPSCWDWGNQNPLYCQILFPIKGNLGGMIGMLNIVLFIFYGIILGWLYGKIKNRNIGPCGKDHSVPSAYSLTSTRTLCTRVLVHALLARQNKVN